MGEVYRARDAKLGRDIALKVLPGDFSGDPQRMARFEREAQLLASLNHPNIAAIYGVEDSGPVRALVMELVEGATLSERIERGALPVEEALPIALDVARALEFAHERGIIHRDLKPANIKITPDGAAKVLDFGLAKAVEGDPSATDIANSPTMSRMATQAGIILGTAAYMSPEQARGRPADRRADIWAFGCVLFEMLSGKQPFSGDTVSDALASVIKDPADWTQLPAATPPRLRELLQRCLQKDSRQRLQAIGDARITLEEILAGPKGSSDAMPAIASGPAATQLAARQPDAPAWRGVLPWALAAVFAVALVVTITSSPHGHTAAQRTVNLSLLIPNERNLDVTNGPAVVLSPDGSRVAYALFDAKSGIGQLYVRELDQPTAVLLEGTSVAAAPFFSPDSQWIAFFSDSTLKKVSVRGGAPVELCPIIAARGGDWGADGNIILTTAFTAPLYRIPASGGSLHEATHLDKKRAEITHRWPQILPGGKAVLFTSSADNNFFGYASVAVAPLDSGVPKILVENAYFGRYLPGGYLTYVSQGTLFMAPFDVQSLSLTGAAIPVLKGIDADPSNGSGQVSFSADGSAAYIIGNLANQPLNVVQLDRKGNASVLLKDQRDAAGPRLSPDGKKLAFQKGSGGIWIYDIARGTTYQLTSEAAANFPLWTPDGQRITYTRAFTTDKNSGLRIYWKRADGSGQEEALTSGNVPNAFASSWSPDGKTLAFFQLAQDGACCEIWTMTLDENGKPQPAKPFLVASQGKSSYSLPMISPDGHWLAYNSSESGSPQIYVVRFPDQGAKVQISTGGGVEPVWSRSGHELFYELFGATSTVMSVPYTIEKGEFQAGKPEPAFPGEFEMRLPLLSYDVTPDGSHAVVFQFSGGRQSAPPTVVLNWLAQARQTVAAGQATAPK